MKNLTRLQKKSENFRRWKLKNKNYFKNWAKNNRQKTRAYVRKWRIKNKSACASYQARRRKAQPWEQSHYAARNRCTNKKADRYARYGWRGILFNLKISETRNLWIRDKAHKLKRPSIDRINQDGNYEYINCRFIELAENIRRAWIGRKHKKESIEKMKAYHAKS